MVFSYRSRIGPMLGVPMLGGYEAIAYMMGGKGSYSKFAIAGRKHLSGMEVSGR
jgi:hypothetical protein